VNAVLLDLIRDTTAATHEAEQAIEGLKTLRALAASSATE
jgi:hypothetical protein